GPGEVLRERAAEDEADRGAADRDRRPDGERARPLRALREGGGDDRERRRRDQRGAESLQRARADEQRLAGGESVEERCAGEDHEPEQEQPLAAEQVAGAAPEQQETAEHERVGV